MFASVPGLLGCLVITSSHKVVADTAAFTYPLYTSIEYATPRSSAGPHPTFAPPYASVSGLIPNQTTTSWPEAPSPTDHGSRFGNAAWSSLWAEFNVTAPAVTTTASPTPVPSSELVKPPPLPFLQDAEKNGNASLFQFPPDFMYGFAGAALQVEGAVKNEGRGPSLTESSLRSRYGEVEVGGPPDLANLNYYLYKQDIARLAAAGVQSYSFSISWSRILPFGVTGSPINQEGLDHYDDLINTVLEYGMTPVVTLHHFDAPLYFRSNSSWQGWDHPEFVDSFVNYAKIALTHYGDRVGTWFTFNEPTTDGAVARNWLSSYNIIMAHAKVVHWYREELKGTGKWSMKLSLSTGFALPLDPSNASDVEAANRRNQFQIGYMANPLFLGAPVPDDMADTIGSKVVQWTPEDLDYVNGTCDFFAFDIYIVTYHTPSEGGIDACAKDQKHPDWPYCTQTLNSRNGWDGSFHGNDNVAIPYEYVSTVLSYFHTTYPSSEGIVIGEVGLSTYKATQMTVPQLRSDIAQSELYVSLLREVLRSINEDGVTVKGVFGWSFVDNWEWGSYDPHYGVQGFNTTTYERYYKRSLFDFVDFIASHGGQ